MEINMQLPRILDSRKSCEQLILIDLKTIEQIRYLILVKEKQAYGPVQTSSFTCAEPKAYLGRPE